MQNKDAAFQDWITEAEAKELSGYGRTQLYILRTGGKLKWTSAASGRKVRYHKPDLLKFLGIK